MRAFQSLDLTRHAYPVARPDERGAWVVTFCAPPALLPVERAEIRLTREQLRPPRSAGDGGGAMNEEVLPATTAGAPLADALLAGQRAALVAMRRQRDELRAERDRLRAARTRTAGRIRTLRRMRAGAEDAARWLSLERERLTLDLEEVRRVLEPLLAQPYTRHAVLANRCLFCRRFGPTDHEPACPVRRADALLGRGAGRPGEEG